MDRTATGRLHPRPERTRLSPRMYRKHRGSSSPQDRPCLLVALPVQFAVLTGATVRFLAGSAEPDRNVDVHPSGAAVDIRLQPVHAVIRVRTEPAIFREPDSKPTASIPVDANGGGVVHGGKLTTEELSALPVAPLPVTHRDSGTTPVTVYAGVAPKKRSASSAARRRSTHARKSASLRRSSACIFRAHDSKSIIS